MPDETLYDAWSAENDGEVGTLGSGSDYTSFLHNGISSLDMGTDQGVDDPVYHYHRYLSTFASLCLKAVFTAIADEAVATMILITGCPPMVTQATIITPQWGNTWLCSPTTWLTMR